MRVRQHGTATGTTGVPFHLVWRVPRILAGARTSRIGIHVAVALSLAGGRVKAGYDNQLQLRCLESQAIVGQGFEGLLDIVSTISAQPNS